MCFCRSLSVGTKTGYRLFSVTAVDKLDCIHEGGIKELFTNTHLTIIHIHGWPSLPETVVRFTLFRLVCSCMQAADGALSSLFVCIKSDIRSRFQPRKPKHEAKHTPSKEKLLFSLSWNVPASRAYNETSHCFSKLIQLENPLPVFPVESPDVYIVERLFSSSLVVVVSLSMPRRMNVYHFKKGTEICNYSYSNNILSVRLNRQVRAGHLSISKSVVPAYSYLLFLFCPCEAISGVFGGVCLHP